MRYRTSGVIAWISLAIIVGVPSTEIFLSKQKENKAILATKNIEMNIEPSSEIAQITDVNQVDVKTPATMEILQLDKAAPPAEASPVEAPLAEEEASSFLDLDELNISKPKIFKAAETVISVGSPIPIEFRLVGEQPKFIKGDEVEQVSDVEELNEPKQDIAVLNVPLSREDAPVHTRVVGDAGMTIGSRIKEIKAKSNLESENEETSNIIIVQKDNEEEDNKEEQIVENGIDEEFLKAQSLQADSGDMLENSPMREKSTHLVKKTPVIITKKYNSIINIGNSIFKTNRAGKKLNIIRIPSEQNLRQVNFYDLIAVRRESANVITIKPNSRQRLVRLNNKKATRVGYAKVSSSFEVLNTPPSNRFVTHGSFISQLPPTRGSSVRLDLVN